MKNNKFALTALMITVLTISSKFIGFLRDVLIASNYGLSVSSDAYVMAQSIITIISTLVITGLNVAFIPMLSEYRENKTEFEYKRFVNNVYTITIVITFLLILLTYLFSDIVVGFFALGFNIEAKSITKDVLSVMLPTLLFSSIVLLNNSYLQSKGKFYVPALIGYPSNLILIFTLIFLSTKFGIVGLAIAFTVGTILQLIVQHFALKKTDFKFSFDLKIQNEGMVSLISLLVPTVLGSGVSIINTTVDRMIGSTLESGSVAALNFSNKLSLFVLGIVAASITTIFYTSMSTFSALGNKNEFNNLLKGTISTLNLFIIPASVGFAVLRYPIVSFVFARGAFNENAVELTASCLLYFSIGLVGFALRDVLTRSFYSIKDTVSPLINGAICVGINIILNLILSKFLGVSGLALATSISGLIGSVLLMIKLHAKNGDYGIREIFTSFIKIVFASILMGSVVSICYSSLVMNNQNWIFSLFISIISGVVVYTFVIFLLKVPEFISFLRQLKIIINKKIVLFKKS